MKLAFLAAGVVVGLLSMAKAVEPVIFKLLPADPNGAGDTGFGLGIAVNEKYIVVGDYRDDSGAEDAGAAYVIDTKTRKTLRKLVANDPGEFDSFGYSVALSGEIAIIGAPFCNEGADVDVGAVYVFNVRTGKQLLKLFASDGEASDELGTSVATNGELLVAGVPYDDVGGDTDAGSAVVFRLSDGSQVQRLTATSFSLPAALMGTSVAMSGDFVLAGAPGSDVGANSSQGRAFLFDAMSGTELDQFVALDGEADDGLGYAVALHGRSVLVGAGGADIGANVDQGAAYLFDLHSGDLVRKMVAPDGDGGEFFGDAVAMSGNQMLIGAPYEANGGTSGSGSAYLVDTITGGIWQKLGVIDGKQDDNLGYIVAMAGSTVVIGAIGEDSFGVDSGAAYGFAPLAQPLPTLDLVKKGDFAPGFPEATLSTFTSFQINSQKEVLFAAGMTGRGAPAGGNKALWSSLFGPLDPFGTLGDSFIINTRVVAHTNLVLAGDEWSAHFIKLAGTGITAGNDMALVASDGDISGTRLFEGDPLNTAPFAGQVVKQLMQMSATVTLAGIATKLVGPSSSDSALVLHSLDVDQVEGGAIENSGSPVIGVNFGQMTPRVSMNGGMAVSSAALQSPTTTNALVYMVQDNLPNTMLARKGDAVSGAGNLKGFLGENVSADGNVLFRASLSGTPASQAEALVSNRNVSLEAIAQKGTQVAGLPTGVKFSRFIRYVMLGSGQALFLAKISGPGVNASNDQAVFLSRQSGGLEVLMREGQIADDCMGAKIGVIQQIDADPNTGSYLILTTLTGSASSSNLAIWMGETPAVVSVGGEEYYVPKLVMRKGSYQSLAGNTSLLTSVKLLVPLDPTGAVAKGMGKAVADGAAALQLTFANKQVLLGTLLPPF